MSIYEDNYDLGGRTLQLVAPENSETHTDMLPMRACLVGWHQELGPIRSPAYWAPRYCKDTWERWKKHGVEDITLEYAESNTPVFG